MPLLIVALVALLVAGNGTTTLKQNPERSAVQSNTPAAVNAAEEKYFRDLEQSIRNSTSPRNWALSTQMGLNPTDAANREGGALLRKAASAAPQDRLVQWLWANAASEASGCDKADPCPQRSASFARLAPDNGAAWMAVVSDAWARGDGAATDAALARMAAATRYDEMYVESLIAWADIYRIHPAPDIVVRNALRPFPANDAESFREYVAYLFSRGARHSNFSQAIKACKRAINPGVPVVRFENCARIGRLMITRGNTSDA